MYWDKFERELTKAYAICDRNAGRQVDPDDKKLRALQGRVKADFMSQAKTNITSLMARRPVGVDYTTALRIYRTEVAIRYPNGSCHASARGERQVREANRNGNNHHGGRGRGGGRHNTRGGRGRGGGRSNGRRTNGSNHPDAINITLRNGHRLRYHASHHFTTEQINQMTEDQRNTMATQRREYRERNNRGQDQRSHQTQLAELRSEFQQYREEMSRGTPPGASAQISQVTFGNQSGSITGGRNEQERLRRANGRGINQVSRIVRVISANTATQQRVQQPMAGTRAANEMDTNADTCCLGKNFLIMQYTNRSADVYAYDPALPPTNVPIVSGATAYDCPITRQTYILIVNEALYYGTRLDHSLFNPNQIRDFDIPVWDNPYDKSKSLGIEARQLHIPLTSQGTKVLFNTRVPTNAELNDCPQIDLTSKKPWEPSKITLGQVTSTKAKSVEDPRSNSSELIGLDPVLAMDEWRIVEQIHTQDERFEDVPVRPTFVSTERHSNVTAENLSERLGISVGRARATLKATLQRGTRSAILPLGRRYRADRMLLKPRLHGKFSTDPAYFKKKSIRGNIASQIYFHKSGFYFCHHLPKIDNKHVGPSLTRFISEYGIPEHLTFDNAAVQVGVHTDFMDTIHRCHIEYQRSSPYTPKENPVEGGIRELKRRYYRLITKYAVPERLWDYVIDYVVDTMNTTVNYSKYSNGRVPLEIVTGITPDISEYLDFTFYGWVYFRTDGGLGTNEIGRWLGVSHRVGPMMTYWILPRSGIPVSTDTVQQVTNAEMQTTIVKEQMTRWTAEVARILDAQAGHINWGKHEIPHQMMFDLEAEDEEFTRNFSMQINPDTLDDADLEGTEKLQDDLDAPDYVNMEVGMRRGQEGELQNATVCRRLEDSEGRPMGVASRNPLLDTRQYEVEYEDGSKETFAANILAENLLAQVDEHGHKHRMMEEISEYRKGKDAIEKEDGYIITSNGTRRKRWTTKGWELHVIWKDGSSNWISLKDMKESFPIEVADYAKDNGIEEEPAFAWWVPHVRRKRNALIQKIKSKYWERTHKYGIRIPRTIKEALEIDKENNDTMWHDAIKLEMKNNRVAFEEYEGDISKLVGYKRITGHMVFDVKLGENFRRKARYCADGHKTEAPAALTYSTVVSRDSVRILLMVAALNGLDLQCADIQNAFLTAPNLERCYMQAGPEFGDEQGKIFIVRRALYGLKGSAASFRSHLANALEDLGFHSSYADPDVWMRAAIKPDGEHYYEYILCYVDDILCISEKAYDVMIDISHKFKFKKDKIAPPENYLGAKLGKKSLWDADNNRHEMWTMSSVDYVKAAVKNVKETVKNSNRWRLPKKAVTPMSDSFSPEMDGSAELGQSDHTFYQELIGVLRWATEIGRVDILLEVSLLSQYQAGPREGHMEQLLRIFAYLDANPKLTLYFDWRQPNIDRTKMQSSCEDFKVYYRDAVEELPANMPKARGRDVTSHAWVDASHAANKKTRRSHTGFIIFVNNAPIIWHSRRQNTVEASTFGSEFIAMKACIEAITHLRYKLRMFGIPVADEGTHIFCDNEAVVKNSTKVESTLNKKHNSIAYHYTRWNVTAGVVNISWLSTIGNLADAFTKRLTQFRREHLFGEWTY